jgi:Tol biopolymer transport system component
LWRLYLLPLYGRLRTIVTKAASVSAKWSPEGTHIGLETVRTTRTNLEINTLFVMKPDGSGRRRINTIDYGNTQPQRSISLSYAWSPNGRRLALSTATNGVSRIYLMDVGGRRLADLTPPAGERPSFYGQVAWSPNSRWIGFERFRGELGQRGCCLDEYDLMRPDGSRIRRLFRIYEVVHDTPSVTWAPSGRRLALVTEGRDRLDPQLAIVEVPSGHIRRIGIRDHATQPPALVWLPGERRIAFAVVEPTRWVYLSIRTDGSHPRELLSRRGVVSAQFSPDGRWILVGMPTQNAGPNSRALAREVALLPTSGGPTRPLARLPRGMQITDLGWQRLGRSPPHVP